MTDINKQVNKSRRIFELDIARVICMYLVVFGHLYSYDGGSPIRVWIYSFHMALFFFVSGILHKERASFSASVSHFAKALLLPAVVFGVVYLVLFIPLTYFNISLYNDFTTPPVDNHLPFLSYTVAMLKFVLIDALYGHSLPDGVIWFLVALFYCKVWTLLLDRWPLLVGGCYLLLFYVCFKYNANVLFIKQSLMALPFYVIGYKFKNRILAAIRHYNSWTLAILFFAMNIALIFINGRSSMFSCVFGTKLNIYFSIILFYINSFFGHIFHHAHEYEVNGGCRMVFKDLKFSDFCSSAPGVHSEYLYQLCRTGQISCYQHSGFIADHLYLC